MKYTYIDYKYAAKTGRTGGFVTEQICSKKSVWCRCLEIPQSERKPGGWYCVYLSKINCLFVSPDLILVCGNMHTYITTCLCHNNMAWKYTCKNHSILGQ